MDIQNFFLKLGNIPMILLQVILIVILGLVVLRLIKVGARRLEKRISASPADVQQQARLITLLSAAVSVVTVLVIFLDALMVLLAFGINITPVLASVGVLSLAISLGAQSLIKDYVGGVTILMEDQYRVGDAVTILDYIGTVEEISLRSTRLRDVEGRLIILSNGDIREVTRAGYDWARAVVDLNVAYNADISTLVQVLDGALTKAQEDAEISSYLLEKPEIQGWSGFTPWSVQVRLTAKTVPDKKLDVATRMRRYAQEALRDAGLPMATPPIDATRPAA